MNKIAILSILFALVAVASARPAESEDFGGFEEPEGFDDFDWQSNGANMEDEVAFKELSEFKITPNDSDEVAYLAPEHKVFDDFCRRSRDLVYTYIQDKNREMVANVFATFFGSIAEVTQQLEEIQVAEAEKATEVIRSGKITPLPQGEEVTEEQAKEHVAKSVGLLQSIGGAVANFARAVGQAAMQELLARLTLLKKTVSSENFKELITQTCTNIQLVLQNDLQKMFKQAKSEIAESSPTPEVKQMLAEATYEKVGCLTTGRTRKVVNVCGVFNTAGPLIFTMMGV